MSRLVRFAALYLLAGMLAAGCGNLELSLVTEAPTGQAATATAPSGQPEGVNTATPADTPAPTATAEPSALPAALYFLSAADQQIWRVERNGRTLTQVTHERAAVTEFDVSPDGAQLAFVTENTLVRANAEGGDRTVLLTGPALTGAEGEGVTSEIHMPRWSPDGATIAFGLNGVNLIAAAGGEPRLIQASDPIPQTRALARFYRPLAWSPDGSRLALAVNYWQEGLTYAVKTVTEDGLIDLGGVCCEPVWSRDSQSLYFSSADVSGYNPPGLWRVPAAGGEAVAVVNGGVVGDPMLTLVAYPAEPGIGQIYAFMAVTRPDANGNYGTWPPPFQLYLISTDVAGEPAALRSDAHTATEAAWAPEAAGVAVREIDAQALPDLKGSLVYLPAGNGPSVNLPADGVNLRWGR